MHWGNLLVDSTDTDTDTGTVFLCIKKACIIIITQVDNLFFDSHESSLESKILSDFQQLKRNIFKTFENAFMKWFQK